jgi:DNA damage-binding protein 1
MVFIVTPTLLIIESEPTRGRLLLFQIVDGTIKLVNETETSGCVYSLAQFQGRLIAGINSRVQLFKLNEGQLQLECSHQGHILALCVVVRGDFVIVGDLMRSISLLLYKNSEGTPSIEEIARDFNPNWM